MAEHIKKEVSLTILSAAELSKGQTELVKQAKEAAKKAYSPYSNFQVGAALRLKDGSIVRGNNQENSSYPTGLCAERVAIFAANAANPDAEYTSIAITAKKTDSREFISVTPCGSCRQVLSEYEVKQDKPIEVIMAGDDGKYYISDSIETLLPFSFSSKYLK